MPYNEHYVPILKTKAGERWALGNLFSPTKPHVLPLLEMIPIPRPRRNPRTGVIPPPISLTDHVSNQCDELVACWGTSQPFYLDTRWLHGQHGDPVVTATVFDIAHSLGLQAIPVAYPGLTGSALGEIARIVSGGNRGCLIRIDRRTLDTPATITLVATAVGRPLNELDLLLDYRGSPMELATDVPRIPRPLDWRELISGSGLFPRSLQHLSQSAWTQITRTCWTGWRAAVTTGGLVRNPVFADYTIRDPGSPAGGGDPPVTLRYTADAYWLAIIHGTLHNANAVNMVALCQSLMRRPEYIACGPNYSAGDTAISVIAAGTAGDPNAPTGGPGQWVQWPVSHHIEFVVKDQILRLL